jgi:hypothetical protein
MDGLDFAAAERRMRKGHLVARSVSPASSPPIGLFPIAEGSDLLCYATRSTTGECVPWAATKKDRRAEDWMVVADR